MAITATLTPGIVLPDDPDEPVTTAELNQGFNPTIAVTGTVGTNELSNGSVTSAKTVPGPHFFGTSGGTSAALTLTLSPALPSLAEGSSIWFKVGTACAAGAGLNVNSLGSKALTLPGGLPVRDGDLQLSQIAHATYCSSGSGRWEILSTASYPDIIYLDATNIGGSANAITATAVPAFTAPAQFTGRTVAFVVGAENTTAVTLAINGISADIRKTGGIALSPSDLRVGQLIYATYTGSYWLLMGAGSARSEGFWVGATTLSTNAYTVTGIDGFPAALYAGLRVDFLVSTAHPSTDPTLSVNGLSATIKLRHTDVALVGAQLGLGLHSVVYDGTNWQLIGNQWRVFATGTAVPSAAGAITFSNANGTGSTLAIACVPFLMCVADDLATGYVAGDRIGLSSIYRTYTSNSATIANRGCHYYSNGSTVTIQQVVASASLLLLHKTAWSSPASDALLPTSWANFTYNVAVAYT